MTAPDPLVDHLRGSVGPRRAWLIMAVLTVYGFGYLWAANVLGVVSPVVCRWLVYTEGALLVVLASWDWRACRAWRRAVTATVWPAPAAARGVARPGGRVVEGEVVSDPRETMAA